MRSAPLPPVLGLEWFSVLLPDPAAMAAVQERIRGAGVPLEQDGGSWRVRDPSGIRIALESGDRRR